MRVFITGGTGLIGRHLVRSLLDHGNRCLVLTRNLQRGVERLGSHERLQLIEGDPTQAGPWTERLAEVDAVVNLAGANLFERRWSSEFKAEIRRSRVETTRRLAEAIARISTRPIVFVQGSAVGYYGDRGEETITEDTGPGDDFLARVCVEWENAAKPVQDYGVRLVLLRTGIVLAADGGALPTMARPIKFFVGGPAGSGQQWVPWIHIDDITSIIRFALTEPKCEGPINGTAPNPVRNRDLTRAIAAVLRRPAVFRAPGFLLRMALGEVADLVLCSQRVVPKRLETFNYRFQFPDVYAALLNLLRPGDASQ